MRFRELLRRELHIVFGARVTWLVLAAAALLVGHSFVLAMDLFSAASRSALGFGLMRREMDPLAGIVRPMLGAIHLAATLFVPVMASRALAIEKERRSYGSLALSVGGTFPVVAAKSLSALAASMLILLPVLACALLFIALGGHIDALESSVAIFGHGSHLLALTAIAIAAAAGTRTVAQATTVAIATSLASWAIDAGEGFAALAWLGDLEWASISKQLEPFEHGIVPVGAILWFASLSTAALISALLLARISRLRWMQALSVMAIGVVVLAHSSQVHRGYDWSEQRRASLPPLAVEGLRAIPKPIRVELFLDRDDGRRAQVELDALSKLRLARPDTVIDSPLDRRDRPREGEREGGYGRIVIHVGDALRETRSTSRRELITLVFEAAGQSLPDWMQPMYAGYPTVIEGSRRSLALLVAYGIVPALFLVIGWFSTRIGRRSS